MFHTPPDLGDVRVPHHHGGAGSTFSKTMEIVDGEDACYRLLAFIALKMELIWRSNPTGKVRPNLPLYQIYTK